MKDIRRMIQDHSRNSSAWALAISLTLASLLTSCTRGPSVDRGEIRILIETPPATLDPRTALDANGQRINMLLFRGLTRVDADLKTAPDLAEKWWVEKSGHRWIFQIAADAPSAEKIAACVKNYLLPNANSPLRGSFVSVKEVSFSGNRLQIDLSEPDPYFTRNASLFRYFTEEGIEGPCLPPRDAAKIRFSGDYEMRPFRLRPEQEIVLHHRTDSSRPRLRFIVVRDETARLQKMLNGEADVAQNSFAASKIDWLMKNHPDQFHFLSREGVNVSYLAFQLEDPILSKVEVRRAIAHAIDRELIMRTKMARITSLAGSFLSPALPEASEFPLPYDPAFSEKLLDSAGFPRGKDGTRFRIRHKTTTNKDGFEMAQIFQEMLRKVGIAVDLEVVESAVFFSSIRKGNFQLYMSRWVGLSDASIFYRTLHSASPDNRVKYRSKQMDQWITTAKAEMDEGRRQQWMRRIQEKMIQDLPYFPLWFWTNLLIMHKDLTGLSPTEVSLSGSFVPLTRLRWNPASPPSSR